MQASKDGSAGTPPNGSPATRKTNGPPPGFWNSEALKTKSVDDNFAGEYERRGVSPPLTSGATSSVLTVVPLISELDEHRGTESETVQNDSFQISRSRRPGPPPPPPPPSAHSPVSSAAVNGPQALPSTNHAPATKPFVPKRPAPSLPSSASPSAAPRTITSPGLSRSTLNGSTPQNNPNIVASSSADASKKSNWQNNSGPSHAMDSRTPTPAGSPARQSVGHLNRSWPPLSHDKATETLSSTATQIKDADLTRQKPKGAAPPGIIVAATPLDAPEAIPTSSLPGALPVNGPVPPPPASPRATSTAKTAFLAAVPNSVNPFDNLEDDKAALKTLNSHELKSVSDRPQPVPPPRSSPVPSQKVSFRSTSEDSGLGKRKPPIPVPRSTSTDSLLKEPTNGGGLTPAIEASKPVVTAVVAPPPPPPKRSGSVGAAVVKVVQWDFDGSNTPGGLSVKQGDNVSVLFSDDPLWCTVALVSPSSYSPLATATTTTATAAAPGVVVAKTGLVPKSYLADLQMKIQAMERMPARPAILEYGKESAFARDLIAIRSHDGEFGPVTLPVVRFWGPSARREHFGDRVQVFIDGRPRAELRMGEAGVPMFAQQNLSGWDLRVLAPHVLEDSSISCLHVRFEHVCSELSGRSSESPARFAECTLFIWDYDDNVVVSDVDGTITLSDVGGHLNTTLLQKVGYSPNTYAHLGVCALFLFIKSRFRCRFLYLTARPLNLCVETRNYLRGLKQDGNKVLPLGPCITDATSYYGSLRREVVDRSSHLFKAEFLADELRSCFVRAGRDILSHPVFMGGFGNKDTDAMAYRTAGLHPVLTFSIDKRSVVTAGAGYASELSSYDDPNLLKWIEEMMTLFQNGKLPAPPV